MSVRQDQVQVNVEINGAKAGATIKELESTAKSLRAELKQLPTDTDAFTAKAAELRNVNDQLKSISNTIKGVDASLKDAGTSGGTFANILSGAASVFSGGAILGVVESVTGGIKEFFSKSIEEFNDAAKSSAQLTNALDGNVEATKKLQAQAGTLQKDLHGLFDDDDIIKAQTRLGLYTKEASSIEQLTPLVLDLAAAKGVDLVTAAEAVGKTVAGNADSLKKLGISVKDAGTEQERLTLISKGLTEAVGGQAKAVSESGTTGWQRFENTLKNFMEAVGGKLSPIISSLGNFLSDLFDKSDPLVAVFKGIFDVIGQVWNQIKQLIGSFGLFNSNVSGSSVVMQVLTGAFGFLKDALKFAGDVMSSFIGTLKELVAIGSGSASAIVAVFTGVKDFFLNVFANIQTVLKGVFTFNLDDIKDGLNGLKNTFSDFGSQVRTAYESGYKKVKIEQQAVTDRENAERDKEELERATKAANDQAKADIAAKKRQAEEAKKLAEEKKKDADELAKKQEEARQKQLAKETAFSNQLLEITQQLQDIRVASIKDETQRELAQEDLRQQREQIAFVKRINDLRLAGAKEVLIEQENNVFNEVAEAEHQQKIAEIKKKAADKAAADAKKSAEELLKQKDNQYKFDVDELDLYYNSLIQAVRAGELKKIEAAGTPEEIEAIKKKAADAEVQIELNKNIELMQLNEDYGKSSIAQEQAIADTKVANAEKAVKLKKTLQEQEIQAAKDALDLTIEVLGQDEAARKKNSAVIKALSIAKVGINLAEELSGIFKNANTNDLNSLIPGIGNALGAVQAAFAVGRAVVSVQKIESAQYAEGGHTGKGTVKDNTGHKVAGVVHANEWVSPQWMTQHPVYGHVIHQLEDARVRGFADGGFTTTPTGGLQPLPSALSEEFLRRIADAVENPTRIKADVVYTEFDNVQNSVDAIKNSASIGKK